jgi:ribosomal protein L11 methyltransferase
MKKWLEVSLEVDGEMAEAAAEVLARFIPEGVAIESTAVATSPDWEGGWAVGRLRVFGYLPVDDQLEGTRQRLEESLWYLSRIRPLPEPQFKLIEEVNWGEAWKKNYKPVAIGERLLVVPAWLEMPEEAPGFSGVARLAIRIDPGMAFGTGTHPTTQLCLEILEGMLLSGEYANRSDIDVIDLGCGTAILATAAIKLGARRGLGVDIDPDAVSAARQNALVNGVAEQLDLGFGSLAEIRAGVYRLQKAHLVLANILAKVIARLLDEGLGELTTPDGCLVLSGILEEQAGEVEAAVKRNGLRLVESRQSADWVAMVVTR